MHRNNELQFAGAYGESGVCYTLTLPKGDQEARSRQACLLCLATPCLHLTACLDRTSELAFRSLRMSEDIFLVLYFHIKLSVVAAANALRCIGA